MGKTVCLDAGHGGKDPGALGKNGEQEKNIALAAVLKIGEKLNSKGISVIYTRTSDKFVELDDRAEIANNMLADLFVSVHLNSADSIGTGFETYCFPGSASGGAFAKAVHSQIKRLGILVDRGVKSANFAVLRLTKMPAVLAELCFINNPADTEVLNGNFNSICEAVSTGILEQLGQGIKLTSISGKAEATTLQMVEYLLNKNPAPKLPFVRNVYRFAETYLNEGEIEGIRGDIAWCQSLKETGYFQYGNIVNPEQNNFAGIGALNNNANGNCAAFESPEIGIRAQIQHLKAYADTEQIFLKCVDPRFDLVKRGSAPYVEWLGRDDNPNGAGWAVPGAGYGASILKILDELLKTETAPDEGNPADTIPKWMTDGYKLAIEKGICKSPEYWEKDGKLHKPPTAIEMFATLAYMPD